MQTVSSLVVIEDVSKQDNQVQQGAVIERQINIKNLNNQRAELDLWIAPIDNRSELLWKWCTFSANNPLVLSPYEEREMTLTFDIPPQANLGLYGYEIIAETRSPVSGQLIRRTQQLQVVRSNDIDRETTPHFMVQPATSSTQPLEIAVGETKVVTVQVENCSKRVDRFYLICADLNPNWVTIQYPERNPAIPGLVTETDGLELNPGETATIQLVLHPPIHAPAGTYFPTLRLLSTIRADLVLLNIAYLKILPYDRVTAEIHPSRQRIPETEGAFEIYLFNQGNLQREFTIHAQDAEHLFEYAPNIDTTRLSPGEQSQLTLTAKPRKWYRRPWWGNGREVTFDLGLDLIEQEEASPYTLTDPPQGTIIWQPRPIWHLGLLLLLALGIVGAIAFLLLQHFFKPADVPQVTHFQASKTGYQEGSSPIHLDWEINRSDEIQKIVLIRLKDGVETYRKNYEFNANSAQPIPSELQPNRNQANGFCQVLEGDTQANQPSFPSQIRWFNRPSRKLGDRLQCRGIATPATSAGNYVFTLQVFSARKPNEPVEVELTDSIAVAPPDPNPAIAAFASTQPAYTIATGATAESSLPLIPIMLNWAIANPDQIQALQLVGLAADGSLQSPAKTYSFEQGIAAELAPFCTLATTLQCRNVPTEVRQVGDYRFQLTVIPRQSNSEPISQTTATIPVTAPLPQIGYFRINDQDVSANPKQIFAIASALPSSDSPPAPSSSPVASGMASAPSSSDSESSPTSPNEINLSWQVEAGEGVKVELLPVPGLVPLEGSMAYPLSASPRRETITLRVTNAAGEHVSQTVVIETARPVEPTPTPTPAASGNQSNPGTLLPFAPQNLTPIELPPQPL